MSNARSLTPVSLLCLLLGCAGSSGTGGPDGGNPSLSVSPTSRRVVAGGSPVNFTSTLVDATGTVSWALSGPGSIDPTTGSSTSYTPPASVGAATTATLTATYGVITSATSTRLPDLSALGITLPAGTKYGWTIQPVAPWASVDEYAGGVAAFPSTSTVQFSIATGRKFTTQ